MNKHNATLAAQARMRRQRILKLKGRGLKTRQIAALEKCSRQRVEQIIKGKV